MPKIFMAEFHPWDGIQVGGHKYARCFINEGWDVFWLANFLNINRFIRRNKEDYRYLKNWKSGVTCPEPGVLTYTPFAPIPYIKVWGLDNPLLARHFLQITLPSFRKFLSQADFKEVDVLWITLPRLFSIQEMVKHRVLVYRMSDNMNHFSYEPKTITEIERELCRRADIVFCTAYSLVEKASSLGANAVYLPNGVDLELFTMRHPEPPDIATIPRPRVLYIGDISDLFDFDVLTIAAKNKREMSFILVGPIQEVAGILKKAKLLAEISNVYLLGMKPYSVIPAYMQSCDIGVIPFIPNELTHSINPIKLYEYAASGLPVVSAKLKEIQQIGLTTLFYETPEEFLECIDRAIVEEKSLTQENENFVRQNTWRSRYQFVKKKLESIL